MLTLKIEGVTKHPQTKKNKSKTIYGAAFLNYPTNFTSPDCVPDNPPVSTTAENSSPPAASNG